MYAMNIQNDVFGRWQIYLQKERCIYEQKLQSPEINIIIQ
jgi:hypothetical protein